MKDAQVAQALSKPPDFGYSVLPAYGIWSLRSFSMNSTLRNIIIPHILVFARYFDTQPTMPLM